MNIKSLFIAGAAALTFGLAAMSSSAKADVFIGIGFNDDQQVHCLSYMDPNCPQFHYPRPRHHWNQFYGEDRHDRLDRLFYRMTCKEARWMLDERGFNRVRARDCGGRYHTFTAMRKGHKVLVKVSAKSGRIVAVNRI